MNQENSSKALYIAIGKDLGRNDVTNANVEISKLQALLTKARISKKRPYIMVGQCINGVRGSKHGEPLSKTSLLAIDFDSKEGGEPFTWDDLIGHLSFNFPYAWMAYTTKSYTKGCNASFRLLIPFNSILCALKHRSAVEYVVDLLPEASHHYIDKCSYNAEIPVGLPWVSDKGATFNSDSDLSLPLFNPTTLELEGETPVDMGGLDAVVMSQPATDSVTGEQLTDEQVTAYLDALNPYELSYGGDDGTFGWLNVGMALAHQYGKSDRGYELWLAWSERHKDLHNERGMRNKYDSFDIVPRNRQPVTFASVIKHVVDKGGIGMAKLERLIDLGEKVTNLSEYEQLKTKMLELPMGLLGADARSMIASVIANTFGKTMGLTRSVITKAITPERKKKVERALAVGGTGPAWTHGWVYIEKRNEFYHIPTGHSINREAFNAKYNRESEPQMAEVIASEYALSYANMDTHADIMYWPGADTTFEHEGLSYVNEYVELGVVTPEKPNDGSKGADAVNRMITHIHHLAGEDAHILLDWLTRVYRNPGKRANWAILLQGGQGVGKSYIQNLMSRLLGVNAKVLDASALANRFTGWATGSVLTTVEEVKIAGESQYVTMDRIKPFITNDVIQIEEKGRDHRQVPNFTNYLFLTNHKNALPITEGDRRYCVMFSPLQSRADVEAVIGDQSEADYFNALFADLKVHAPALAYYFAEQHEYGEGFDPNGRAPITGSFKEAIQNSKSATDIQLEDLLDACGCDVINDDIIDTTHMDNLAKMTDLPMLKTHTLRNALLGRGLMQVNGGRIWVKAAARFHRVWFNPSRYTNDEALEIAQNFHASNGDEITAVAF